MLKSLKINWSFLAILWFQSHNYFSSVSLSNWSLRSYQLTIIETHVRQFVGNKPILKRVFQETKHAKFSEKQTFLSPWYEHISGGKKCLFFEKFGVLCFLVTFVLKFALLPYYRRITVGAYLHMRPLMRLTLPSRIVVMLVISVVVGKMSHS